jgi:hypothetical protein
VRGQRQPFVSRSTTAPTVVSTHRVDSPIVVHSATSKRVESAAKSAAKDLKLGSVKFDAAMGKWLQVMTWASDSGRRDAEIWKAAFKKAKDYSTEMARIYTATVVLLLLHLDKRNRDLTSGINNDRPFKRAETKLPTVSALHVKVPITPSPRAGTRLTRGSTADECSPTTVTRSALPSITAPKFTCTPRVDMSTVIHSADEITRSELEEYFALPSIQNV